MLVNKRKTYSANVEELKNALFTLALMKLRHSNRDDMNMIYSSFDDTKLPMLSVFSLENACYTYMMAAP